MIKRDNTLLIDTKIDYSDREDIISHAKWQFINPEHQIPATLPENKYMRFVVSPDMTLVDAKKCIKYIYRTVELYWDKERIHEVGEEQDSYEVNHYLN
jgi:hypothetical protein